ncbi:endonuclease/exonuclease/phosphatase family protein [Streptomyces canus]|uniref:endonuclease/exonuclease/phosphatase family protein n=1 Tax=Streptomyces canus TaxID=58343 RepID=UPI0033B0A0AF
MTTLRLTTFNIENLFARWRFKADVDPATANTRGWIVDQTRFEELGVDDKAITGAAVQELRADVLCLQEVENVDTLKHFRAQALGGRSEYPYAAGVDGNDPRLIDVAVLSKLPITRIRSYQHLMDPASPAATLFSRDCLEVDIEVEVNPQQTTSVTLFVNHFKSMLGGRAQTRGKRERQAKKVMDIVTDRFGHEAPGDHPFVVLGDLNDYLEPDGDGSSGIDQLVTWGQIENPSPACPRKTSGRTTGTTPANTGNWTTSCLRYRSPRRCHRRSRKSSVRGPRCVPPGTRAPASPGVGQDKPKASDHCPVIFNLEVS